MYKEVGENRNQKQRALSITQLPFCLGHTIRPAIWGGSLNLVRTVSSASVSASVKWVTIRATWTIWQQGLNLPDRTLMGSGDEISRNICIGGYIYIRFKNR